MKTLIIKFWFLIVGMAILYVLLRLGLGSVLIAILFIIAGYLAYLFYRSLK